MTLSVPLCAVSAAFSRHTPLRFLAMHIRKLDALLPRASLNPFIVIIHNGDPRAQSPEGESRYPHSSALSIPLGKSASTIDVTIISAIYCSSSFSISAIFCLQIGKILTLLAAGSCHGNNKDNGYRQYDHANPSLDSPRTPRVGISHAITGLAHRAHH